MNSERRKELHEIIEDDIKNVALDYAKQFGIHAQRSDCSIEPIPPPPLVQEIGGGGSATRNPIVSWTVVIRQNGIRIGSVLVEYSGFGGCVNAMGFRG